MKNIAMKMIMGAVCLFLISGCGSVTGDSEIPSTTEVSFETTVFQGKGFKMEIPVGWELIEQDPKEPDTYNFKDPKATNGSQLFTLQKVNVEGKQATTADAIMRYDQVYKGKVKSQFPNNDDFAVGWLKAPFSDVIVITYTVPYKDYKRLDEMSMFTNTVGESYQILAMQVIDKQGKLVDANTSVKEVAYKAILTLTKTE